MSQHALESTWNGIRAELRRAVPDLTFHLWLDPLSLAGRTQGTLQVSAPTHVRTLVEERYLPLIRTVAERVLDERLTVALVDEDWTPDAPRPAPADSLSATKLEVPALNPKYTFEQFVIGDGNRLAHAAALAVAEQPAQAYNPLFLYGPPGLGKTHLLHAIANYLAHYGDGLTLRYATSDEFTNAYVRASRHGDMELFKTLFRGVDVLLLDDVQFLAERTRTQEELFHTFNALYEHGCQLVVTSDRPPAEMNAFERRLVERFASGLVAELEPPELDVRLAILRKRVALDGLGDIPEETLRAVASQVGSSVRALEGALIRLVAYASLRDEPISPELARRLLRRLHPASDRPRCSLPDIKRATARVFSITTAQLDARSRQPELALPRQVAMYLARELTDASLPAIGAAFGGRNHSTVLHAHRRVAAALHDDPHTADAVAGLRTMLTSGDPDRGDCDD